MTHFFSISRFYAMFLKEFIQAKRDRITFAMILGLPIIQLILFGYAINNDPHSLPTALVYTSNDPYTRAIVTALEVSDYYEFSHVGVSASEANDLMQKGEVSFIVTIPSDIATRIQRKDKPTLLVAADATDPAASSGAVSALKNLANEALARVNGEERAIALQRAQRLQIIVHRRYNPEGISQYNTVPGLLGVIMQITMVLMTALSLTRERERGTMENLLAMPANSAEIMLGKVTPYLCLGAVQMTIILGAGQLLFDVPFVGSLWLILFSTLIYVFSLVLLGYFFSTIAKSQMQAMQLMVLSLLPSILLSGFMFPFRGMPHWAQYIGECLPITHFIRIIRGVMLKGADLSQVGNELAILFVFVFVFSLMALSRSKRTLD
ncbi:ABC transporter permease [Polycladidibacter hongkongensis]|uniref:ABC transporter permease n=1 Tax=Polycladidibacter hongkongensis TaxID=1647556 RepID=UPI00082D294F|nr:ABC transporter permease [Pseudovibrio hongkongensis]